MSANTSEFGNQHSCIYGPAPRLLQARNTYIITGAEHQFVHPCGMKGEWLGHMTR